MTDNNAAAYVAQWLEIGEQLAALKKKEMQMRKEIFAQLFPKPEEGANAAEFFGIPVTGTHKLNRNLDEAALDAVMAELPEDSPYRQDGVLIKYKAAFVMDTYRAMPEKERKIFEQALKIEEGAPTLEFKPGKGVNLIATLKAIAGENLTEEPRLDVETRPVSSAKVSKGKLSAKKPAKKKK